MLAMILTVAGKDWRLFWSDYRSALFAFLVPIVLASAFGLIFDRPTQPDGSVKLPVLVVIDSNTAFNRLIREDLISSSRLDVAFVSAQELNERLQNRNPGVAIVIPNDLDATESKPTLEIRHHPLCALEAQWAEGAMTELVMKRLATEKFGPLIGVQAIQPTFQTRRQTVGSSSVKFNSYSHSFCGMTLQYLLFWGMESGLMLLRERQRGVWKRLRVAPIPFCAILLGKAVATATIALLQVATTFAFGYFVFGISLGHSLPGLVLITLAISALSAATGLLVAALGDSEARARSASILVILGFSMLGGLWLPSFLLPEWLRNVSLALPTTWAMQALDGATWQERDFVANLPSLLAVVGFTLAFFAIAFRQFIVQDRRARRGIA